VKALFDEQLSPKIAVLLREAGSDVVAVTERDDLVGSSDRVILEIATREGRADPDAYTRRGACTRRGNRPDPERSPRRPERRRMVDRSAFGHLTGIARRGYASTCDRRAYSWRLGIEVVRPLSRDFSGSSRTASLLETVSIPTVIGEQHRQFT
jgi:hypothetical protein